MSLMHLATFICIILNWNFQKKNLNFALYVETVTDRNSEYLDGV